MWIRYAIFMLLGGLRKNALVLPVVTTACRLTGTDRDKISKASSHAVIDNRTSSLKTYNAQQEPLTETPNETSLTASD